MKKTAALILLFVCITNVGFAKKEKKVEKKKETVEIRIDNMCNNCINKINRFIAFEEGVTALSINQEKNSVNITYWGHKTDTTKLKKAFSKVKLNVEEMKMLEKPEKKK